MNHHGFGGAVIPAMAGLLFWNKAKVQEVQEVSSNTLPAIVDTQAVTGVAQYLAKLPVVTGVAKYVIRQDKSQSSSVEKYLLRQAILERNTPPTSGVAKYLNKVTKESLSNRKTSIDNYILKQELATRDLSSLTGVAKYQAEVDLIERKKRATDLVEHYKQLEIVQAQLAKENAEKLYEAEKLAAYQTSVDSKTVDDAYDNATGVGRYLTIKNKKEKTVRPASSVAKYIAKKIAVDSQKPQLSSVEKYLHNQTLEASKKPKPTGVMKYLLNQKDTGSSKIKKAESGVDKYLSNQEEQENKRPSLSGVSKYLEKQEKNTPVLRLISPEQTESEVCLEGEFIPADEYQDADSTGVSRYLQRINRIENTSTENADSLPTGVARYLQRQSINAENTQNPTGVDKYLLRRPA